MEGLPEWDPETVDRLTDDWHQATEILDKIHRVALLLPSVGIEVLPQLAVERVI
jgi:hypothetical protein